MLEPTSWLQLTVLLSLIVIILAYYFLTSTFTHWRDKGVKYVQPYPLVGSMLPVLTLQKHMVNYFKDMYTKYENEPFVGYYQARSPSLLIRDPQLIKNILVKDFTHFVDHGFKVHEEADPLQAKNLFAMEGQKWREMRNKLSPTFSTGRIKALFPLVSDCAKQLEEHFENVSQPFEMKDILARYNTDVIASCAFGIQSDAMKNPNCEFRVMGRKLLEMDFWRGLKTLIIIFAPEISLRLRMSIMSEELTSYFRKMVRSVMDLRSKTGLIRRDFMQLLIELKDKGCLAEDDESTDSKTYLSHEHTLPSSSVTSMKLTDDDVTAQATVFFLAGFETSSTVMSFAFLELAVHFDVQKRAQMEIDRVLSKYNGHISYQALQEMKYLDWIMQESMRKYPPTNALIRMCTNNYYIPGTDVCIEKGTPVIIPIHALQNDPKYFHDPETFQPERFSNEHEIKHLKQFIHMPFGEGPRQCIGYRFAKMQIKLGLLAVLKCYEVHLAPNMTYPVKFDPRMPIPQPIGKFWMQVKRREKID